MVVCVTGMIHRRVCDWNTYRRVCDWNNLSPCMWLECVCVCVGISFWVLHPLGCKYYLGFLVRLKHRARRLMTVIFHFEDLENYYIRNTNLSCCHGHQMKLSNGQMEYLLLHHALLIGIFYAPIFDLCFHVLLWGDEAAERVAPRHYVCFRTVVRILTEMASSYYSVIFKRRFEAFLFKIS